MFKFFTLLAAFCCLSFAANSQITAGAKYQYYVNLEKPLNKTAYEQLKSSIKTNKSVVFFSGFGRPQQFYILETVEAFTLNQLQALATGAKVTTFRKSAYTKVDIKKMITPIKLK